MKVIIQLGSQGEKDGEKFWRLGAVFGSYPDDKVEDAKKRLSKISSHFLIIDGEIFSAEEIACVEGKK